MREGKLAPLGALAALAILVFVAPLLAPYNAARMNTRIASEIGRAHV